MIQKAELAAFEPRVQSIISLQELQEKLKLVYAHITHVCENTHLDRLWKRYHRLNSS